MIRLLCPDWLASPLAIFCAPTAALAVALGVLAMVGVLP